MKQVIWIGSSRELLRDFPYEARREAGEQLWRVQQGAEPVDWRPMSLIGPGATEIRIHRPHEHRVVYVATHKEGIYVLHAFEKKTQKTLQHHISKARANYAEMDKQRKEAQAK